MQPNTLFYSLFLLFFSCNAFAQNIWNVNNLSSGVNADFTTLQAAIDGASAGDIIQLHPSPVNYGNGIIAKKLTIIGVGYDIAGNADSTGIQTYTASALVLDLTLNAGADHSIITGIDIQNGGGAIILNGVSNILIQRNKIYRYLYITNSHDVLVNSNYFYSAAEGTYGDDKFRVENSSTNIIVTNNIFDIFDSNSGDQNVVVDASSLVQFEHNIFLDHVSVSSGSFRNNIFLNNIYPNTAANVVENNVFTATDSSIPVNNITGANQEAIFVGVSTQGSYSGDGKYHLKINSPARGAGTNGVDAGVFGGDSPYRLSGIPFTPLIYEINAPSSGTSGSGLPVNIKIRANN